MSSTSERGAGGFATTAVPIGLVLAYQVGLVLDSPGEGSTLQRLEGGLFYTGHRPLVVGPEVEVQVVLRYYF